MPAICYGIDGRSYDFPDRYIPCNGTAIALGKHSSCCALGDVCLTNGFCQSGSDAARKANTYWRNGCTDSTWKDAACPRVCVGLDSPDTHAVFQCPVPARQSSTSYCCPATTVKLGAATNTACCGVASLAFNAAAPQSYTTADMNVISIFYITPPAVTTTLVSTPPAVTVTTTPRPSLAASLVSVAAASASASVTQDPSEVPVVMDTSLAKKVGIPLGVFLAVAIAVIVFLCAALCAKERKREEEGDERPPMMATAGHGERPVMHVGDYVEDRVGRTGQ